jgi:two-component system NtrC family sensor kinase
VAASASELQQVFLNLFNNAFDAMEGTGGTLKVATLTSDNGMVAVNVADTGPGMPEAILQRIYDPFFTTKPVGKGTGLGLSICYGIINKMGGEIKVSSIVGVGTTFQVLLPPFDPAVHAAQGAPHPGRLTGRAVGAAACPAPRAAQPRPPQFPTDGQPAAPGVQADGSDSSIKAPGDGGGKDTA